MKKILFLSFTIALSLLLSVSCENDNDKSALKMEMVNKHKIVGETHNQILSLVLEDLKQKKMTYSNGNDFSAQCKNSLSNVLNNLNISEKYSISKDEVSDISGSYYEMYVSNGNQKSTNNQIDSLLINNNFSNEFRVLATNLINISNNHELSIAENIVLIDNLDNEAIDKLTDNNELNIYFSASSVAKSSFEYWHNNIDEWYVLFNSEKGDSPVNHPMLNGVVGADVGGAVGGALTAAITGPGIIAGAIIGSGATSTAKFVENAWNYFFN